MKLRILFAISFTCFCLIGTGVAQGPGFMSKHFYAKYDLGYSAAGDLVGGRTRSNFSLNYIFHKRFSVGISHNRYRLGVTDFRSAEAEIVDLPTRELGFNIRAYLNSNYIAPVGTYFIAEVSNVNVDLSEVVENDYGALGLKFGFGISRVLYNKLVLDVSTTLGGVVNEDFLPFDVLNANPVLDGVSIELVSFNVLTWRVGVGYLLF